MNKKNVWKLNSIKCQNKLLFKENVDFQMETVSKCKFYSNKSIASMWVEILKFKVKYCDEQLKNRNQYCSIKRMSQTGQNVFQSKHTKTYTQSILCQCLK